MNPSGSEPTKITQDGSGGIWCKRDCGPTFGTGGWFALKIWHGVSSGHLDLRVGFVCPPNTNRNNYFAGKSPFEINEMEVFKVEV